jgi:PAS domain-containing protein
MELDRVRVPSGVEQFIEADELFFSTTDRRGLIRSGNSVFVRVSRFPLDELVGAPHNIVRHPDMPAGVFRLMWDRLLAGRPAGAYVRNMARDGSAYWVFATMTPLGDGFLSVRLAPRAELFRAVRQVYKLVAEAEREAAARPGTDRREVARIGPFGPRRPDADRSRLSRRVVRRSAAVCGAISRSGGSGGRGSGSPAGRRPAPR